MAAIDIGPAASDRSTYWSQGNTAFNLENPANGSGTITDIEIWANTSMAGCKVGTFYGTAPNFTPRDVAVIGNVTSGSKQTFSGLSIAVEVGDYIGLYFASGRQELDSSGFAGIYWLSGDQFGAGEQAYSLAAGFELSLYGTGEETPAGITVTPATIALSDTQFVPILKETLTPTTLALSDTQYIPLIYVGTIVTPTTLSLGDTQFIPILKW